MNYNLHTHTARCRHAVGEDREYVEAAVRGHIRVMGFSDHIPFTYADGTEDSWRVSTAEAPSYIQSILALRDEYADRIEIHIGFEAEYIPTCFEEMVSTAAAWGAEYLILGQHYLYTDKHSTGIKTYAPFEDEAILKDYVDTVIEGMSTGRFTYLAHPDVMQFDGTAEAYKRQMRRLCIASRKLNVPLEINFLGIRDDRCYPNEAFWRIVGEEQAPVTFGFDAHAPENAYDAASLAVAKDMVSRLGLCYVGMPTLRPLV